MIFDRKDPEHAWIVEHSWGVQTKSKKLKPMPDKLKEFQTMEEVDLLFEINKLDKTVGGGIGAPRQKAPNQLNMFPSIIVD
jgi:hypothetical protein